MRIIRSLIGVYAIMQLVLFALPYVSSAQRPWMTTLERLCEPGVKLGNRVAARLMPDKRFKINVGPLAAAVLCFIASKILEIFF